MMHGKTDFLIPIPSFTGLVIQAFTILSASAYYLTGENETDQGKACKTSAEKK
jgi:hypothetical protein